MSSDSSETPDNICVVCFKNVEIFSIGSCDHMVCYECSTRMRVLCRQNECPICRQELPRVVFTCTVRPFNEIQSCSPLEDKKFKICFQTKNIQDAFQKLLEHSCSVCPNSPSFKSFQSLYDHMKREHDLYYCDLCVEHLKIFTSERQCYTKKTLEQHKKKGDADDRSHRGHPLCQFCDIRFMDNDCLYRHLRRDHLYCHFCDADGLDLYYSSYDYLLDHFRTEHYLCEEGNCVHEKFTPVFRTDIDLKAHRASAHGRNLGKAAAKQARTLELEFTLKPRPRQVDGSDRGRTRHNDPSSSEGAVGGAPEQSSTSTNIPKLDSSEFPSLPSGPLSVPVLPQPLSLGSGLTIHAVGRKNAPLAINDENFPVLGVYNDSAVPGTSVRLNINQDRGASGRSGGGASRNVSIHVNHRSNGEKNIRIRQDDFPALSSSRKPQTPVLSNWACISSKKPTAPPVSSSTSKAPKQPLLENDFPTLNSKFSTNLNLKVNEPSKPNFVNIKNYKETKTENKGKKASSVTIPVQSQYSEAESSCSSLKSKSKKKKSKGNVEEKSDTAKKKPAGNNSETKGEDSGSCKHHPKSALTLTSSIETPQGKPLPKVEDWFEGLKKADGRGETQELVEFNISSTDLSSNSTKINNKDFPPVTTSSCGASNNNSNNNNNNNNNNSGASETNASSRKLETKAPPGFDNLNGYFNNNDIKKPPPGFSVVDFPRLNGLTFTNSSGQSFAISTDFEYIPPVDFEVRNQNLVSKVNKIISGDTNLEEFRKKSILFRQDLLSAHDYYQHCVKAMGESGLREVFPELLVLLPDISKQQELFLVYSKSENFSKSGKNLEMCSTCRQVVSGADAKQHFAHHSMQQNFPVLTSSQWTK